VVLRDQFGRRYESPSRLDAFPVSGHDVYLTIDAELQDIVERSLAEAIDRLGAAGGDVVVMDPTTGELLAVAALRADGSAPASVFTSVFEPGSTAKIFAAAALLRHGLVSPTDTVWGENGRYNMGNRVIEDDHVEGWLTLSGVVRRSSNIGIAKFADRLTPEQQYGMLRAFGLGTPTGVDFPVESAGLLARPSQWSPLTTASLAIGYEVAVTTLQLAAAYAAIANDGILLRPTLVHRVVAADGKEVYLHRPESVRRVVGASIARELREMLRDVVSEEGTGTAAALVRYEVAGKTGTARRAGPNGYVAGSYTASFASMFPADDPQLVMVVKLEDPRGTYASVSAAPLTRSVLEQILAAQTGVLDLPATSSALMLGPLVDDGIVPYVLTWPVEPRGEQEFERVVPDVIGLRARTAARRLHQTGLRVRYVGSGPIESVTPAAGTRVRKGTLVTVVGSRGGPQ
jgi:cell division protein FtsI (penicillin-binding protein 3)